MTDNPHLPIRKRLSHVAVGLAVLLYGLVGFSDSGINEAYAQETEEVRVPPFTEEYTVQVPYEETYTVQVPYTYTEQETYTYTVQVPRTENYYVDVPYTYDVTVSYQESYTVSVPYTIEFQVPVTYTYTVQVAYTYTQLVQYTYTEMVEVTSTIQVPYTYTVQVPYTVTRTRSVPPCHPMWGCTQESYTVTLYRTEQRTGTRSQTVTSYRQEQRTGTRSEERTGYRPEQRTGTRMETRTSTSYRTETRTRTAHRIEQRQGQRRELRSRTVYDSDQRTGTRTVERTGTRSETRTRTVTRTETRTRQVYNYETRVIDSDGDAPDDDNGGYVNNEGTSENEQEDTDPCSGTWAVEQCRLLLSSGVDEEDLPEFGIDSTKADLEALLDAVGDQPGFDIDRAKAELRGLLDDEEITREKMAGILCAGATTCNTDDPEEQIDFLEENGITVGRVPDPDCTDTLGNGNCFDGESDMTNSQLVTFLSRLLGDDCDDCGGDDQTTVNTDPLVCPSGWTGSYPNCVPPQVCPDGWTGTYPNCVAPVVNPPQTCPDGWTGSPPNCVAPPQVCPDGWTGTYPNCVAPAQPPVVSFFSSSLNVNEGSAVTIYAVLNEVATTPSSVRFDLSGAINGNGSCSAGADFYTSASAFTFNNSVSASVSLTACDDSDSTDEAVTLSLTNSGIVDLQLGSPSTATVTINDDDATPVVVSYGQASYTVDEGSTVTVSVQLDTAPGRTVTIPITTFHQGGASTADYSGVLSSVTFQSGDTQKSFVFTATQDQEDDDNESVGLSFGTLTTSVSAGSPNTTTVSITDDDDPPIQQQQPPTLPVVSVSSTTPTVDEGAGSATFTITLDNTWASDVQVDVATSDGTATAGSDYTAVNPHTVTIPANQQSVVVSVSITDDSTDETDETFTLTLSNPSNATLGTTLATTTISDNDTAQQNQAPGLVQNLTLTCAESSGVFTLTADWQPPLGTPRADSYIATFGGNGEATTFGLVHGENTTTATATRNTAGIYRATIRAVNSGAQGRPTTANGQCTAPVVTPVVVSYGQGSYPVDEGASVEITVSLDTAPGRTVTIPISTSHQGGVTSADYSGVPNSVTFLDNDTEKRFSVTATQDTEDDDNEVVNLSFGTLPASVSGGSPNTASIPIGDDDPSGTDDGYGL